MPGLKRYIYRSMGKNAHHINIYTDKCDDKKTSSTFSFTKWLLSLGAILSWYSYFFGYTFFKSKMKHLGFDVTLATGNVHEIFYQAYQGLTFGLVKVFEGYSEAFWRNVILILIIAPFVFVACLAAMYLFDMNPNGGSRNMNLREWMQQRQATFRGKLTNALIFTMGVSIALLSLFLLPVLLTVLWSYLFAPDSIGAYAASQELANFSCEPKFDQNPNRTYYISCSHITLKDHRRFSGQIIYQDDKNIYLINKIESRTLTVSDIEDNYRDIMARPEKANP